VVVAVASWWVEVQVGGLSTWLHGVVGC
jgi:hypothetical protein